MNPFLVSFFKWLLDTLALIGAAFFVIFHFRYPDKY
jgi:hypothetical protein